MHFAVSLHERGMAVRSIKECLSGLAFHSKAHGVPDFTWDFRLHKMLEGWNREAGTRQDDRVPITPEVLHGLRCSWGKICSDIYEACLFNAASLVAFFGALRISELVA